MMCTPVSSGQVIYLAGPSSTGKSTYANILIKSGWLHFEADHFLSVTEITHAEKFFKDDLLLMKQALTEEHCTPERILGIITGDEPEVRPDHQENFDAARARIKACLDQRWTTRGEPDDAKAQANWQEIFITMLEEAKKASSVGKNIIIDCVGMIGERPEVSAPGLIMEKEKPNIWDYKGLKIEQYLKYVPIEYLAKNIFHRNQHIENRRNPIEVLEQYGERFKKAADGDEVIDELNVKDLLEWVERFVKIEHLKLGYANIEQIDETILSRMQSLSDTEKEEMDREVTSAREKMFKLMEIDQNDEVVLVTYRSNNLAKPKIVNSDRYI